jgi:hypothetical protein
MGFHNAIAVTASADSGDTGAASLRSTAKSSTSVVTTDNDAARSSTNNNNNNNSKTMTNNNAVAHNEDNQQEEDNDDTTAAESSSGGETSVDVVPDEKSHRLEPATPVSPVVVQDTGKEQHYPQQRQNQSFYNPFFHHSPTYRRLHRPAASLFSKQTKQPTTRVVLDSDQALEEYAHEIRVRLRYVEMMELAKAAERAAEAGQERFAARPSTYRGEEYDKQHDDTDDDDDDDSMNGMVLMDGGIRSGRTVVTDDRREAVGLTHDLILRGSRHATPATTSTSTTTHTAPSSSSAGIGRKNRPERIRRRSLSAGTTTAVPFSRTPKKMTILALRDVKEVFPDFAQLHTHLRTHYARDHVDRKTLVFREERKSGQTISSPVGDFAKDLNSLSNLSRQTSAKSVAQRRGTNDKNTSNSNINSSQMDFFRWVTSGVTEDSNDGETSEPVSAIGELLAQHIHTPPADTQGRRSRGDAWPPGFDIVPAAVAPKKKTKSVKAEPLIGGSERAMPTGISLSFIENDINWAAAAASAMARAVSPRALFDDEHDSDAETVVDDVLKTPTGKVQFPATPTETRRKKEDFERDDALKTPTGRVSFPATPTDTRRIKGGFGPDFVTPVRLRHIRSENRGARQQCFSHDKVDLLLDLRSNDVADSPSLSPTKTWLSRLEQPRLYDPTKTQASDSRNSSTGVLGAPGKGNTGISYRPCDVSRQSSDDALVAILPELLPPSDDLWMPFEVTGIGLNAVESGLIFPNTPWPDLDEGKSEQRMLGVEDSNQNDNTVTLMTEPTSPIRIDNRQWYRSRHVKVSVYASPPNTAGIVGHKSSKVLQQSQLLPLRSEVPLVPEKADSITRSDECACLALSGSSANSSDSLSQPNYDLPPTLPPSEVSGNHLRALKDQQGWDVCTAQGVQRIPTRRRKSSSIAGAFQLFSGLSPSNSMFTSQKRLYVRSRENDAFMNNYLYCSKPLNDGDNLQDDVQPEALCTEPCQDAKGSCEDFAPGFCCAASVFSETGLDFHRRAGYNRTFVSLGGSSSDTKPDSETWFDMATEQFDHVLEHLSGHDSRGRGDRPWTNIKFQAPSLKKGHTGSVDQLLESKSTLLDAIVEKKSEEELDFYIPRRRAMHSRHASLPPTLPVEEKEGSISEMNFERLVYDMLRDGIAALSSGSSDDTHMVLRMSHTADGTSTEARVRELRRLAALNGTDKITGDDLVANATF